MSPLVVAALTLAMVGTAFLSGLFGMAGGLILVGILLALLPLPAAMVLHAVTQMASNGWRALLWRRHIGWRAVGAYLAGTVTALALWAIYRWVPDKPTAMILLGASPFLIRLVPARARPDPENLWHGLVYGTACMSLMLVTGVSGPLMDTYFLGGRLDRKQIVATKAFCQLFSHTAKLAYFGGIIDQAAALDPVMAGFAIAASMLGTTLAARLLARMTDAQFRRWANRLITTIAVYYLIHGTWLFALS